jgi:hypothetical protein
MKKIFVLVSLLLVVSSAALAFQPELIGGARNGGVALGLMAEHGRFYSANLRFGAEATSYSARPVLLFYGAKFLLGNMGQMPTSLTLCVMAAFGNTSQAGLGLGVNIDRLFGYRPLFAELGVDFLETAKLQLQLGFKF